MDDDSRPPQLADIMGMPTQRDLNELLALGGDTAAQLYSHACELRVLAARFEELLERLAPRELAALQLQIQQYNAAWKDPRDAHALWTASPREAA